MPLALLLLFLLLPLAAHAQAANADAGVCRSAIAAVERATGVPDRLMQAVAIIESGRRSPSGAVAPWPWTINVEGAGEVFDTKQQAIAAVTAHRARGARSIDVGCMQVNLMHHASAFASLEEALDPVANARYGARFLQQLLGQTGSWPRAVAGYHSLTPDIGGEYARKVLAVWARPELPNATGMPALPAPAAQPTAPLRPAIAPAASAWGGFAAVPSLPAAMPGRMLAPAGGATATLAGRGLDSYRAIPTRGGAASFYRRS